MSPMTRSVSILMRARMVAGWARSANGAAARTLEKLRRVSGGAVCMGCTRPAVCHKTPGCAIEIARKFRAVSFDTLQPQVVVARPYRDPNDYFRENHIFLENIYCKRLQKSSTLSWIAPSGPRSKNRRLHV